MPLERSRLSTWKEKLLLGGFEPEEAASSATHDVHDFASRVCDHLQDLEFFTSIGNHNIIATYLYLMQDKCNVSRLRVKAACQIFALLLVRVDKNGDIKHIYDWLAPLVARSVFKYAFELACWLVSDGKPTGRFRKYWQAIDDLYRADEAFDYPVDLSLFHSIKLSDFNSDALVRKITAVDVVQGKIIRHPVSHGFVMALMLNIDDDSMYPHIGVSFALNSVRVTDVKMQAVLNQNLPDGYACVFNAGGDLVV